MNWKKPLLGLALILGAAVSMPQFLLAGEHGGKEHGGQEHGGTAVEEGPSHAAAIQEAAALLKATHPDLAARLEAIAAEEE